MLAIRKTVDKGGAYILLFLQEHFKQRSTHLVSLCVSLVRQRIDCIVSTRQMPVTY